MLQASWGKFMDARMDSLSQAAQRSRLQPVHEIPSNASCFDRQASWRKWTHGHEQLREADCSLCMFILDPVSILRARPSASARLQVLI